MSHFAEIKPNGLVIRVVSAEPDIINNGVLGDPLRFVQTSYNAKFRNKFATPNYMYDRNLDMFISPKPFLSWVLDVYEDDDEIPRARWVAPVKKPSSTKNYVWKEETKKWVIKK